MRITRISAGVLAGIVIFIAVCELALRLAGFSAPIWFGPDRELGWSMRPGVHGWFTTEGRAYVQVNQAGFRDRPHTLDKPAGSYRIAVVGDSAVEARQVELKDAFWWQLQENLAGCPALRGRQVEVMGFGVSGYGTAQQYLLLRSTVMRYQPDLVLLAFAGNDVVNNSAKLEPENERPFYRPDGEGLKLDASFTGRPEFVSRSSGLYETYRSASDWLRTVQLVQAARHGVQIYRQAGEAHAAPANGRKPVPGVEPTANIAVFAPPTDATLTEAWLITERLIALMNRYSALHNARFAVTMITHSAQIHPDAATRSSLEQALGVQDLFYMERRLTALGAREGFPVIPLAPEMQKRAAAENTYFHGFGNYRMGWGHWNETGHRAAAAIMAPRICASVPPSLEVEVDELRRAAVTDGDRHHPKEQ